MYEPNLLAWQWALYAENHRSRGNLLVHILAVPMFECGGVTLVMAPFAGHPLGGPGGCGGHDLPR